MTLRLRARAFAKWWHRLCRDVHIGLAGKRQWQANARLIQAAHHIARADEHAFRAAALEEPEPTETGVGDPFRPV